VGFAGLHGLAEPLTPLALPHHSQQWVRLSSGALVSLVLNVQFHHERLRNIRQTEETRKPMKSKAACWQLGV